MQKIVKGFFCLWLSKIDEKSLGRIISQKTEIIVGTNNLQLKKAFFNCGTL